MNKEECRDFKVGDRVRATKDCFSTEKGKIYTVEKDECSYNLVIKKTNDSTFCTCQDSWELIEEPKEEKKIAVHCPTKELWEKVLLKMFSDSKRWVTGEKNINISYWGHHQKESCVCNKGGLDIFFRTTEYWKSEGYTIISAEEYLGEEVECNGKMKFKEYEKIAKVGDKVRVFYGDNIVEGEVGEIEDVIEGRDFFIWQNTNDGFSGKIKPSTKGYKYSWCRGFEEDYELELINQGEEGYSLPSDMQNGSVIYTDGCDEPKPKPTKMGKIISFAKNLVLSATEKKLRKHGLKDECGNYTAEYEEIVQAKLNKDNEEYVLGIVGDMEKEEKAEKKDK